MSFLSDELISIDNENINKTKQSLKPTDIKCVRPEWHINHFISYGQSLSTGQEGWPALGTTEEPNGTLMIGDSAHAKHPYPHPHWVPFHESDAEPSFKKLKATVIDYQGNILSKNEQAVLPQGSQNLGINPIEIAIASLRLRMIRNFPQEQHNNAYLVSVCGVGGQTIEQLSKNATPHLFNRVTECIKLAEYISKNQGITYGLAGFIFIQGEYNYHSQHGGTQDKTTYKKYLNTIFSDLRSCFKDGPELLPAAIFMAQTGAGFTNDATELSIGQAQLDHALIDPNSFLVGPYYPVSSKGGHLDANGYRWLGEYFGKVMYEVLFLGRLWKPLHPTKITYRNECVLLEFHVPVPPLVFDATLDGHQLKSWVEKGFSIHDSEGSPELSSVEIIGQTLVLLKASRLLKGPVFARYASGHKFNGRGNLRDSDDTQAFESFEYTSNCGQSEKENIVEYAGKKYPLWNWCVAFNMECISV